MTEESFRDWKDQTRKDAMEKEVQRLRATSQNQSQKIGGLRRTIYFQYFFFIVLFSILFFKGLIIIPGTSTQEATVLLPDTTLLTASVDTTKPDTITPPPFQIDTTSLEEIKNTKGILFCIQIGAYTGIDLSKYKSNLVSIQQDSFEGINQFTLGRFTDYTEAEDFLAIIQQMGFKDAFIMSFRNGQRIHIQEILDKQQRIKKSYPSTSQDGTIVSSTEDSVSLSY